MDALTASDLAEMVLGQVEVEEEPQLRGQRVDLSLGISLVENFDLLIFRSDSGTKSAYLMNGTHLGLSKTHLDKFRFKAIQILVSLQHDLNSGKR
jgi:hypothetical protein